VLEAGHRSLDNGGLPVFLRDLETEGAA